MSLIPQAPKGLPIKDLERLWLDTACLYEEFNETVMEDPDWDLMGKELNERKAEWSPYFTRCLPGGKRFNPGTTGSGLDWTRGIPGVIRDHLSGLDGDYSSVYAKHIAAFARHHQGTAKP